MLRVAFVSVLLFLLLLPQVDFAAHSKCVALNSDKKSSIPINDIVEHVDLWVFQQSNVPALMIGIVSGNDSVLISCGETAMGNGERPTADTVWAIGSVSKVITTTILSQMVVAGKVLLTDPVEKYLPGTAKVPQYPNRKITLLDLATHTSGFERNIEGDNEEDYQNQKSYTEAEAFQWMNHAKLLYKPGASYLYSNFAYSLLGQALAYEEKITYAELVRKYISENLEMKDTTVQLTDDQKKREAKSYWMNGDLIKKDWPFDFEAPSGGVYSTGNDLIKFIRYHLNIMSNENINKVNQIGHATYVYQNEVENPLELKDNGMGLGWHIDFPNQNLPVILHKNGWVSGFTTWVLLMSTEKVGIFSITNKPYLLINSDLKSILGMVIAKKHK